MFTQVFWELFIFNIYGELIDFSSTIFIGRTFYGLKIFPRISSRNEKPLFSQQTCTLT